MKSILTSLVTCLLSFSITFFGLHLFYNNSESNVAITESPSEEEKNTNEIIYKTEINGEILQRTFRDWNVYNKKTINLSNDFMAIDVNDKEITKEEFLTKLKEGKHIPIKVKSNELIYKLQRLSSNADNGITEEISSIGATFLKQFKKEGKPFPEFNFKDLDDQEYSTTSTDGKIKIIKFWFIDCESCTKEFPKLNKLYDSYEVNDKLVFFSLAFDDANKLKNFLSTKEFRYPVIPNQEEFVKEELGVKKDYPTHMIVDQNNNIIKVTNNINDLVLAINKITGVNVSVDLNQSNTTKENNSAESKNTENKTDSQEKKEEEEEEEENGEEDEENNLDEDF